MADVLLVFRVNPILINWELEVDLHSEKKLKYGYGDVEYEQLPFEECHGVFQFARLQDLETRLYTTYTR